MRRRSVLMAVDERPIPRSKPPSEVARLIRGAEGKAITLLVSRPGALTREGREAVPVALTSSTDQRAKAYASERRAGKIFTIVVGLIVAAALIAAAAALRLGRFGGPIAHLLSFTLLVFATQGTWRIWDWLRLDWMPDVLSVTGFGLLVAVIPALPTGRYVPAGSRWFMLLGPLGLVLAVFGDSLPLPDIIGNNVEDISIDRVMAGILPIFLLLSVVIRLQHTPRGPERQQLKWMAVAAVVGVTVYVLSILLNQFAGNPEDSFLPALSFSLSRAAFLIGLLACVFAYRLNDADAIIGRSAGFGIIATLIAAISVASSSWVEGRVRDFAGTADPAVAAGVTTLIALAIFGPARKRVLEWVERKFQPNLVSLKSLPERMMRWQQDDDPQSLAERVLKAIVSAVDATSAALVTRKAGHPAILALHNADPAVVEQGLTAELRRCPADDSFPVVIDLGDEETPLALLLGPRGDGAQYAPDERASIGAIRPSLTDALRSASVRAARNAALVGMLDDIRSRIPRDPMPETRQPAAAPPER